MQLWDVTLRWIESTPHNFHTKHFSNASKSTVNSWCRASSNRYYSFAKDRVNWCKFRVRIFHFLKLFHGNCSNHWIRSLLITFIQFYCVIKRFFSWLTICRWLATFISAKLIYWNLIVMLNSLQVCLRWIHPNVFDNCLLVQMSEMYIYISRYGIVQIWKWLPEKGIQTKWHFCCPTEERWLA